MQSLRVPCFQVLCLVLEENCVKLLAEIWMRYNYVNYIVQSLSLKSIWPPGEEGVRLGAAVYDPSHAAIL